MRRNIRTILEIGESHIKFFQSELKGKRNIQTCEARPLRLQTDEETSNVIHSILSTQRNVSSEFVVLIPRRFVIVKQVKLPSHQEQEIKKMLGLQLATHIPYPVAEVFYDYSIIEKEASGYSKLFVVVVHKDVLDRYGKMMKRSSIVPSKITISSYGLLAWYHFQKDQESSLAREPVLLINIDTQQTELVFIHNGHCLFSRMINVGAKDLTDEQLVSFVQQIQLSLKTYVKENMGPELKSMVVISSLKEAVLLKQRLEQEFSVTVTIRDMFDAIACSKNINVNNFRAQEGVSLAAGLGLCIEDLQSDINILPVEWHQKKTTWKNRLKYLKLVGSLALVILGVLGLFGFELYRYIASVDSYQNRIKNVKKEFEKSQNTIQLVDNLRREMQDRLFVPQLITTLYSLTPKDISFRNLSLNEEGTLTIQGFTSTSSSVNTFQSSLLKSPLFKDVNLQFATQRKIFNMDVTDFQITTVVKDKKR
jgi:type IV pilus assembly protein PilM